jgi:hypothetical protein
MLRKAQQLCQFELFSQREKPARDKRSEVINRRIEDTVAHDDGALALNSLRRIAPLDLKTPFMEDLCGDSIRSQSMRAKIHQVAIGVDGSSPASERMRSFQQGHRTFGRQCVRCGKARDASTDDHEM